MVINAVAQAQLLMSSLPRAFPTDLQSIVSVIANHNKPIEILYSKNLDYLVSALTYSPRSFANIYIMINAKHCVERQRFSLAHELGHLHLGHRCTRMEDQKNLVENPIYHWEADEFAAEILMPSQVLYDLSSSSIDPISLIYIVRKSFQVSLTAAAQRLIRLEILKGAILLYNQQQLIFAYNTQHFNPEPMLFVDFLRKQEQAVQLSSGRFCKYINQPYGPPFYFYCHKDKSGNTLAACLTETTPMLYNHLIDNGHFTIGRGRIMKNPYSIQ